MVDPDGMVQEFPHFKDHYVAEKELPKAIGQYCSPRSSGSSDTIECSKASSLTDINLHVQNFQIFQRRNWLLLPHGFKDTP